MREVKPNGKEAPNLSALLEIAMPDDLGKRKNILRKYAGKIVVIRKKGRHLGSDESVLRDNGEVHRALHQGLLHYPGKSEDVAEVRYSLGNGNYAWDYNIKEIGSLILAPSS